MMAAYNFQREFAEPIKSGAKQQTIRARRKNGYLPKPGELIALYTGMRTKGCERLGVVWVTGVRPIQIQLTEVPLSHGYRVDVTLEGASLSSRDKERLARADGFSSLEAFAEFFAEKHGAWFAGYLIEWRP
jgi:hypothetical protein